MSWQRFPIYVYCGAHQPTQVICSTLLSFLLRVRYLAASLPSITSLICSYSLPYMGYLRILHIHLAFSPVPLIPRVDLTALPSPRVIFLAIMRNVYPLCVAAPHQTQINSLSCPSPSFHSTNLLIPRVDGFAFNFRHVNGYLVSFSLFAY